MVRVSLVSLGQLLAANHAWGMVNDRILSLSQYPTTSIDLGRGGCEIICLGLSSLCLLPVSHYFLSPCWKANPAFVFVFSFLRLSAKSVVRNCLPKRSLSGPLRSGTKPQQLPFPACWITCSPGIGLGSSFFTQEWWLVIRVPNCVRYFWSLGKQETSRWC